MSLTNERAYLPGDWLFTEGKPAVALLVPQVPVLYQDGTIEWRPLHCTCRISEDPGITVAQIEKARESLQRRAAAEPDRPRYCQHGSLVQDLPGKPNATMCDNWPCAPVEPGAAPQREYEPPENLACGEFKPDLHSKFCDECGYPRSEHRKKSGGGLQVGSPECAIKGCGQPRADGDPAMCADHRAFRNALNQQEHL